MDTIKKAIVVFMFVLPFVLSVSCIRDEHEDISGNDINSIELAISLPNPVQIAPVARSASPRTDYNTLDDLNIIAYYKDGTTDALYIVKDGSGWTEQGGSVIIKHDYGKSVKHLSVVANWGTKIQSDHIGDSPEYLKGLEFLLFKNTMYADAVYKGKSEGRSRMEADLIRTKAMITVSMEVEGSLKDGLTIKPTTLTLKNVPEMFRFGKDNKARPGNLAHIGGKIENLDWGILSNTNRSVGKNNHSSTGEDALFLYENKQGTLANGDQTKKAAVGEMQYASYIELEAEYEYIEDTEKFAGTITYRFCPGSNTTDNYDVIRNHHYAVTLRLSGWGGANEGGLVNNEDKIIEGNSPWGVNWRVDMNLDKWDITSATIDLDSHMVYDIVQLTGTAGDCTIDDVDWLWIWDGNDWKTPDQITSVSGTDITYLTNPWRFEESDFPKSDSDQQYRDCNIVVNDASTHTERIITLRQWAPLQVADNLYMERFESDDQAQAMLSGEWGLKIVELYNSPDISTNDNADGWNNTLNITKINNYGHQQAASYFALYKGGNMLGKTGLPSVASLPPGFVKAMYYLPNMSELSQMYSFSNSYSQSDIFDTMTNTGYWSCIPTYGSYGYYTDYFAGGSALYNDRDNIYKIRAVYRPGAVP